MSSSKKTRSSGPVLDPEENFPEAQKINTQLPGSKTLIGLIKFLMRKENGRKSEGEIMREVGKLVYTKWYHDTVYCIGQNAVVNRVQKLWRETKEGLKRLKAGRDTSTAALRYKEIVAEKDSLFDIFAKDKERRDHCELFWRVKMSPAEKAYYEDQKGERKKHCDKAVDIVWYTAMMKRHRLKERSEEAKREMSERMAFKPLEEIENILEEDGEILEDCPQKNSKDDDYNQFDENRNDPPQTVEKRKLDDLEDDGLPPIYRHIRNYHRKIKECVYRTLGDLMGKGLSYREAEQAVIIVANKIFDRNWNEQEMTEKRMDLRDMMPSIRGIRDAMGLLETEALASTVDMMEKGQAKGKMVTHAIDSTTKRGIGQFATQGIHIGRDSALPLPLINICGESTEDIALQVK